MGDMTEVLEPEESKGRVEMLSAKSGALGAFAVGAQAVGAFALGAFAVGALAMGALAISASGCRQGSESGRCK